MPMTDQGRRDFLRTASLAAGAAVLGLPAGVTPAQAADPVTIVLPLGFNIALFDAMNAYSGGHFARFGIDAKVIGANSSAQTVQLVASGQATIGRGAPADVIRPIIANQTGPKAIAAIIAGCPFRVFSLKAKPVLGLGARRIVAERRDAARDIGPDRAEREEVFLKQHLAALQNAKRVRVVERADP